MSLRITDSYATVFQVNVKEKYVACNLSSSRRNKNESTDQYPVYINSYWNARFVGGCLEKAKDLNDKDRIKILSGSISHEKGSNVGEDGKNIYYYNLTIFDFELLNGSSKPNKNNDSQVVDMDDVQDLPF